MASPLSSPSLPLTILLLLLSTIAIIAEESEFILGTEKTTRIQFYLHNVLTGPNATAVQVVQGPVPLELTNFGDIVVIDDALTEGPSRNTTLVGRAQGIYVRASLGEVALLMAMNIVFTGGEYNGSTLAVLTRNPFLEPTRELSVVGGTGRFRMARGYVLSETYMINFTTRESTHLYNVYVVHY